MESADLTPAERRVWEAFPRGGVVDFREGTDDDPERGGAWGPERTVRAEVLRALLLGGPREDGEIAALRIEGARISGSLDLQYGTVEHAVRLMACHFDQTPDLYGARFRQLNLSESYLPGLDATAVQVEGVLRITDCRITGPVRLGGARISRALFLDRARLGDGSGPPDPDRYPVLALNQATIENDVLGPELVAHGTVLINGTTIAGLLNLNDAEIVCPGGTALDAAALTVGSDVFAARLRAEGTVTVRGARIPGELNLAGAELINDGGTSLRAVNLSVGADLNGEGLRSRGEIRLTGARIEASLKFEDAELANPGGQALDCTVASVGLDAICDRVKAEGTVKFTGARVEGALSLRDAELSDPGGRALDAAGITIGGDIDAMDLTAHGMVKLTGATVTGMVDLTGAELNAPGDTALSAKLLTIGSDLSAVRLRANGRLNLRGMRVPGQFNLFKARLSNPGGTAFRASSCTIGELWLRESAPIEGMVTLRRSQIDLLHAEPGVWPDDVTLDGLTYGSLSPHLPADQRLPLLERDREGYVPYAYEQLAAAYKRVGDDAAARTVQLAKQRRHRLILPWYARLWGYLQDVTVGYGFRPMRAAAWLVALLLTGAVAYELHHPKPLKPGEAPDFNPPFYTLDLLLPIIDFGQEKAFKPQGWYQWLAYLLIVLGWVLATTIVAGITRAVSRQ